VHRALRPQAAITLVTSASEAPSATINILILRAEFGPPGAASGARMRAS